MKLVILGDLHIISPRDGFREAHERRAHFAHTWGSLKSVQRLIRQESPDLVVSVGDLIDWYSDENRDEALYFLDKLGAPWLFTPGNHDIAGYRRDGETVLGPFSTAEIEQQARRGWAAADVSLDNRLIEIGSTRLLLMDSATVDIPFTTQQWLEETMQEGTVRGAAKEQTVLFTHVPFNIRLIREFITSVKSNHDPLVSVQRGTPGSYESLLTEGVGTIFTGHLHFFPGHVAANDTAMYLLPLSVVAAGRVYPQQGTVTVLVLDGSPPRQVFAG